MKEPGGTGGGLSNSRRLEVKTNHQPRLLVSICRNQSRKVEAMALKLVLTKGQNPEHLVL
jgi:hypothetical protein